MIHPATELRRVSPDIGYGVFATADIPTGTIVFAQDALDIVLAPDDPRCHDPRYRALIARYAYTDPDGSRVLSWDIARFMNHCCRPNTLSTAYGFEIAVSDIPAGAEITDDYGLFSFDEEMILHCGHAECRRVLRPDDIDRYAADWDHQIQAVLPRLDTVPQPLLPYVEPEILAAVREWVATGRDYRSVSTLKPRWLWAAGGQ